MPMLIDTVYEPRKGVRLYLHCFMPGKSYGHAEDTVGCVHALEVKDFGHGLQVKSPGGLARTGKRIATQLSEYPLLAGGKFYLVENDPAVCQRPNGRIIHRWEP